MRLVPPLHKQVPVVRMRTLFLSFIACVGVSLPAAAEYGQHSSGSSSLPSSSRSLKGPSSNALSDALSACQVGRSGNQSRGPAIQPTYSLTPPVIDPVIPVKPVVTEPGPFARENPREQAEFPGEEKYQACLKGIPAVDFFKCPQVLSTCQASTVDGGKTKIRPLSLDAGNPCTAGTEIYEMACGRGLEFSRFSNDDIKCGPTSFPLADAK